MEHTKPISQKEWDEGYKNRKTLYVNYQYHKDVCRVSLERCEEIASLKQQLDTLTQFAKSVKHYESFYKSLAEAQAKAHEILTSLEVE